ncbi:MAG TPA: hypothetical protein VFA20_34195 [Myxococcaceae bacterium]|nr:hypothetical protein [Myxococcaceae bacterium]
MPELEITWVRFEAPAAHLLGELEANPHEDIVALGGRRFAYTHKEAIDALHRGVRLAVRVGDGRVPVSVVEVGLRGPYVRAHGHGDWSDELLGLPRSPKRTVGPSFDSLA